jgi:hypothetical protein
MGRDTPFGFGLLSFNQSQEVEVYSLPTQGAKEARCLGVAVSNPHLLRAADVAVQLSEMVQRVIHPAQLMHSDDNAKALMVLMAEQVTRYGTVLRDSSQGILVPGHGNLSDAQILELVSADGKSMVENLRVDVYLKTRESYSSFLARTAQRCGEFPEARNAGGVQGPGCVALWEQRCAQAEDCGRPGAEKVGRAGEGGRKEKVEHGSALGMLLQCGE